MTLVDDLKAARALIADPADWGQGWGTSRGPGKHCAATACNHLGDRAAPAMSALAAELPPIFTAGHVWPCTAIFNYNDNPATTHNDILALFDRAIDAATLSQQKEA